MDIRYGAVNSDRYYVNLHWLKTSTIQSNNWALLATYSGGFGDYLGYVS